MTLPHDTLIRVGRVAGLFGIRGWLKIESWTEPRERVLKYAPWILEYAGERHEVAVAAGRSDGRRVFAHVTGVDDRDAAALLLNATIAVPRSSLPAPADGEYYWADLIGLVVRTGEGRELGTVERMLATGANDVLVVRGGERERLIPFTVGDAVQSVDLAGGVIDVDWDPDF